MAYGDVKQNFPKGTLNSYWYYIELCRLLFPDEDGTQIDKLQEALIRYSLISPWPLPDGDDPELFIVRFFASIIQETGASAALIDSVLKTLKENELLRVNKRNQVVKFDGAAARKLLLEAK